MLCPDWGEMGVADKGATKVAVLWQQDMLRAGTGFDHTLILGGGGEAKKTLLPKHGGLGFRNKDH